MAKLFAELLEKRMIEDWTNLLDWIFDDDKFDRWSPQMLGKLTKKVKKLQGIGKENYKYNSVKNLVFPKRISRKGIKIIIGKKDGEARDWIRHIRNGIAHGKTRVDSNAGVLWIEIKDFKNDKDNTQTAYYYMPTEYIVSIYKLYREIASQN